MRKLKHRILMVEDSKEDQEVMRSHLCSADDCEFDIQVVETGAAALEAFEKTDFDCVLLDCRLPDMDGIKVLERLSAQAPLRLPVVFVTGQGDEKLAVRAMRAGAADYIVKSHLSAENLYRAVQNVIEKHEADQRLLRERARFEDEQRNRIEAQQRELAALAEVERERKRLAEFFQQIPTPVVVLRGHQLVFEFINKPMRELIGYEPSDERDALTKLADHFGREVVEIAKMVYTSGRVFNANEFEVEREWNDDKKTIRYFNVNFEPFRDDEGHMSGVIFMMNDITQLVLERHLVEQSEIKARESEERFRQIAEVIPHMIWVVGPKAEGEYLNSAWMKYTGSTDLEKTRKVWVDFVFEQDRKAVHSVFHSDPGDTNFVEFTYRLYHASSKSFRHQLARAMPSRDEFGQIQKRYVSSFDVHDERKLTQHLRNSEQRLLLATSTSRVGIWEIDVESQKTWRNPEHDRAFGYTEPVHDWSIEIFLEHVLEEDRSRVRRALETGLESHKPFGIEFPVLWPNQTLHWLSVNGGVNADADGRLRMAGTVIDITERKFREQDLRDAKSIAIAANETKTAFLANMSHEIRTPLNAIIGFTDLISREETPHDERSRYAETVQRNGRALMQIIDDILDLSKIEAGKLELNLEQVDLAQMLDDLHLLFHPVAAAKDIGFSVNIAPDVFNVIRTDSIRLRQVLMNVINNAIKFTDRGSVTLSVYRPQANAGATGWICFSVTDTGIGISDENQGKLFQAFSQADGTMTRKFGGTGLGLMLSRRLAKLLGGSFYLARSRVGEGSTFELRIPDTAVSQVLSKPAESRRDELEGRRDLTGVHVLLIDDSPDGRLLAKRYLTKSGASVEDVSSANEALQLVEQNSFDAIVTDIQMPEMDGYAFARELRRRDLKTPLIGLSAHVFPEDRQRSLESGMNDHIGKPVKQDELLRTIHRWITPPNGEL